MMKTAKTLQACIQQFSAQLNANGRKLDEIQEQIEKIKKRRKDRSKKNDRI